MTSFLPSYLSVLVGLRVVESERAVGVVLVAEALARRPVLVLGGEQVVVRVPVARELRMGILAQYCGHFPYLNSYSFNRSMTSV